MYEYIYIYSTGQLVRLELLSKIHNLVAHNAVRLGHEIDLFVMLDNEIEVVKQTYWRFDYSGGLYNKFACTALLTFIEENIATSVSRIIKEDGNQDNKYTANPKIKVRVILAKPTQNTYVVTGGVSPVGDKLGPSIKGQKLVVEPAASRFQNNMRWMTALRECVKWVMDTEYEQQHFYDLVMRLRDDSFVLGPWSLSSEKYSKFFVTAAIASNHGVNDHNFVVDRAFADAVLRGMTEDYYLDKTLAIFPWQNPENRIMRLAKSKKAVVQSMNVCELPVVPLRGIIS